MKQVEHLRRSGKNVIGVVCGGAGEGVGGTRG